MITNLKCEKNFIKTILNKNAIIKVNGLGGGLRGMIEDHISIPFNFWICP